MAEAYYKKELRELMALPENKKCVDCGAPSPQWASVQHGTLICLECSGIHRSFGVHISFVRSVTMDKWTEEQLRKLRLGGNANFTTFCNTYPASGGYPSRSDLDKIVNNAEGTNGGGGISAGGASAGAEKGRVMKEKYGCWAVKEYREKLAAESAEPATEWHPSSPPTSFQNLLSAPAAAPGPASATRARGGRGSPMPPVSGGGYKDSRSASPFAGGAGGGGNEDFFAGLGETNARRRDDVPPSQGGKYTGFGSAPDPPTQSSSHPAFALSSHAAPSLDEFQTAPLTALTKSWGLFSSAVTSAGKEIHESVVKPGMARAGQTLGELNDRSAAPTRDGQGMQGRSRDPREIADRLSSQAKVTGGWLSSIAGEGWQNLNTLAKEKGGVDLSAKLGQLGLGSSTGAGRDGFPRGYEYEDVRHDGAAYHDDVRDGWDEWDAPAQKGTSKAPVKKQPKTDKAWDDEWKDF